MKHKVKLTFWTKNCIPNCKRNIALIRSQVHVLATMLAMNLFFIAMKSVTTFGIAD